MNPTYPNQRATIASAMPHTFRDRETEPPSITNSTLEGLDRDHAELLAALEDQVNGLYDRLGHLGGHFPSSFDMIAEKQAQVEALPSDHLGMYRMRLRTMGGLLARLQDCVSRFRELA